MREIGRLRAALVKCGEIAAHVFPMKASLMILKLVKDTLNWKEEK
jgi:hypothetical protein